MQLLSDTNIHLENKKLSRAFFAFLMLMYSLVYMTKQCFAGALAVIVEEGSLSLTQASIITAAFYVVYAPLQILGGICADKYNPERLIAVGLLGSAVANVVIYFNQNFWVMLVAWVFSAVIQFALWPSVFKILSSQLVRSDRPKMVFFISFTTYIGLALSYFGAALIPRWQDNFVVSAVVLVLLALILLVFCKKLSPHLKKDTPLPPQENGLQREGVRQKPNKWKIFISSGFVLLLLCVPFRVMVENGEKTMSPTMLSQSYEAISPSIGNLLNILIVLSGMLGLIAVKFLLSRNRIKNEVVGILVMFLLTIPFVFVLQFVGTIPVWVAVASLCIQSFFLSPINLLAAMFNMRFIPYGLNGTAAGLLNAVSSFGIVLQFTLFGSVAEEFGWSVVAVLWIVMVVLSIILTLFALRPAKHFAEASQTETSTSSGN